MIQKILLQSVIIFAFCPLSQAEVPLLTPAELQEQSSHIIVGKVNAVYTFVSEDEEWRHTSSVAEVSVEEIKKGKGLADRKVIYVHFWNQRWIGKGLVPPYSGGHYCPAAGTKVTLFMEERESRFHILLPNGTVVIHGKSE